METTKTVKYEYGTITFRALFNKKHPLATVFIHYKSTERRLLYVILEKFINEKLTLGFNPNNNIPQAVCTTEGILMKVQDSKIFSVIQQVQRYVCNTFLNTLQSNLAEKGNYQNLYKSINSFDVFIVGGCRNTEKALAGVKPRKLELFVKGLNATTYKEKDDFNMAHKYEPVEIETGLNTPLERMMFIASYGSLPYTFKGSKIVCLNPSVPELLKHVSIFKNIFQAKVKTFQTSFGNIGSPSANDKDGKKFKEKCALILASESLLSEMYATLHRVEFRYKSLDELKQVDPEAMKKVKAIKIK